jgi:hypothetical protein
MVVVADMKERPMTMQKGGAALAPSRALFGIRIVAGSRRFARHAARLCRDGQIRRAEAARGAR